MRDMPLLRDYDQPINALVVGATAGIGLALATQLASDARVSHLFTVARSASRSAVLAALAEEHGLRITRIDCDIRNEAALAQMALAIRAVVPALHLTINTAGVLHAGADGVDGADSAIQPEKALTQVTLASLQASFAINAFAPILLAKALLSLMRHAEPAVFASLSARVGSISDNRIGGWYSYRGAKAAQNQLLKTLAIELTRLNRRSIVLALHPGTTDTGLSKPFQGNVPDKKLFTPAFVAAALLDVIAQRQPADSGGFYAWDGVPIGW